MKVYGKHRFPGRLFIVEGIDGSGKSTQLSLLQKWLESEGYGTFFSEWNSSALVRDVTRRGKRKHMLTPMTFSLIHATDFADRTEQHIIPPLKAGALVLADRYVYTAFARDVARGVNAGWVRNLYRFAVRPSRLLAVFDSMADEYGFHVVETSANIENVFMQIKPKLEALLIPHRGAVKGYDN